MKTFIIGATEYIENGISMVNGLNNMDIETGYFGYRSFIRKYGQKEGHYQILQLIDEHIPDWIFCQYQYNPIILPDFFKVVKERHPNIKISLMSVDMRNELDKYTISAGKYVDVCFQKGRKHEYQKNGLNCKILQEGFSDLLFFKKNINKEYDIVFAGNVYKNSGFPGTIERVGIISYLIKHFNIKILGNGWDKFIPKENILGFFSLPKINDFYNKSKIILNINHFNNIEHYWSIRMIEGMASGNLMITKYIPKLENYFTNHKDIVWFYSLCDCVDLIKYYLNHDTERENIIKNSLKSVNMFKWESIMKKAYKEVF